MEQLTPRQIVAELDRYIIGQKEAKRAGAIALRNRWRRQKLHPELRDEVAPEDIKYTEVGSVGRDVEWMVRDLTELAVGMVKGEKARTVQERAREVAEERLVDLLLPRSRGGPTA